MEAIVERHGVEGIAAHVQRVGDAGLTLKRQRRIPGGEDMQESEIAHEKQVEGDAVPHQPWGAEVVEGQVGRADDGGSAPRAQAGIVESHLEVAGGHRHQRQLAVESGRQHRADCRGYPQGGPRL